MRHWGAAGNRGWRGKKQALLFSKKKQKTFMVLGFPRWKLRTKTGKRFFASFLKKETLSLLT
jgi:hypothetical protein